MKVSRAVRDIVVIGASAGGTQVLLTLARDLPRDFRAAVLVVQHIGKLPSALPELMAREGALPTSFARNGQLLQPGTILVAPPDQHLLIFDGAVRLTRDAKENHARPAIDVLFRSAAVVQGPRVIGVILSGRLDDGTAGMQAIKACGGLTVVQDPSEAEESGMPQSAIDNVPVDFVAKSSAIAGVLARLVGTAIDLAPPVPRDLRREHELTLGAEDPMEHLDAIGRPSKIVCPDCSGVLWEISGSDPKRYRCHTGHAYTVQSLEHTHAVRTDQALWTALRALQEREELLRQMAQAHRRHERLDECARLEDEADHVARHAAQLQTMTTSG